MKRINRVEYDYDGDRVTIQYSDAQDPKWVEGRVLAVTWRNSSHVVGRLMHVTCHIFILLVQNPECLEANDEILQQWVGRLFDEQPVEDHETP